VNIQTKDFQFEGGLKKTSLALIAVGVLALVASFALNKTVGWVDFLVNNVYLVTMSVSGIFFLAVTGVLQASWLAPYKRIPEAMTKFLPYGFALMLLTYFGLHSVYEWTHMDVVMNDPILLKKKAWLNEGWFMFRMVVIFIAWLLVAARLRSLSKQQDQGVDVTQKIIGSSALTLVVFSLAICVAAFDWLMSVEPHWFSTIYGVGVFAGSFVSGIAFITISVVTLRQWGYFENIINENHFHDLGKWMFGFSIFWAYIWLSQFLLIWYANIPEETEYYVLRLEHWKFLFFFNLIINWAVPFFALMSRGAKRNPKRIKMVAMILLVGHFVDLYLMVAPKVFEHHGISNVAGLGALQVMQLLGYLGLFIFIVGSALSKNKLVSSGDPQLAEGIHLHQ
jgi:hypothetical protein